MIIGNIFTILLLLAIKPGGRKILKTVFKWFLWTPIKYAYKGIKKWATKPVEKTTTAAAATVVVAKKR